MIILNRSLSWVVALCRISSSVVGLISGVPTSAAPRLVLQISDLHLRRYPILKLSFRHAVERLRIFLSPHLKKKKMNTATKDPPQSELEPRTPRSRILSLSTWAICDSTKAGGKKTLKYGRAHSASRAAVVWRWTWRSCSSLTVVCPLFSLKGRDNSLV